ncbi:MAG: carbon-nitrogen hydrolase family protein [bacterium]|nr:carbon-nitrogen hydrolase family protein [bacterium]
MRRFVAAVAQMASGADRARNVGRASELVRTAAARGARLVVLPEVFAWRGPREAESDQAETIPGPTSDALAAVARETCVWLCMGSVLERGPHDGGGRSWNTSVLVSPSGEIAASYRKIHLFDVELPGRVSVRESDARAPGTQVVTVSTELGTIGMAVCYDLRFPELFRRQVAAGAELLTLPSAFTFVTGAAHWAVLCRARAIESQCYLLAANQTGPSAHGHLDFGHSMIVDPWGTVLAEAPEGEGLAMAEIDRDYVVRVRREMPCLEHRRL